LEDKKRCKQEVASAGIWFRWHRCKKYAVKDGYCKQHHPDTVTERQEKRDKKFDEQQKQSTWYQLREAKKKITQLERKIERMKNEKNRKNRTD